MRAEVGYQFILYIQIVIAAFTGVGSITNYSKLQGEAGRIFELIRKLTTIGEQEKARGEASFVQGDRIKFEAVDIPRC